MKATVALNKICRELGVCSPKGELGKGETLNKLLPMPPEEGPPLPRMLALRWPWKK